MTLRSSDKRCPRAPGNHLKQQFAGHSLTKSHIHTPHRTTTHTHTHCVYNNLVKGTPRRDKSTLKKNQFMVDTLYMQLRFSRKRIKN